MYNLWFPCTYILKKPKQVKSPLVNFRTEKAIGVDLRGPRPRVSQDTDHRNLEIAGKLAFAPNICVQV
jgi:hypothetical protein